MFFFYTVVGQDYGHVIADCFDVPIVVYDGGAQATCLQMARHAAVSCVLRIGTGRLSGE
jgi:hypothetical protein